MRSAPVLDHHETPHLEVAIKPTSASAGLGRRAGAFLLREFREINQRRGLPVGLLCWKRCGRNEGLLPEGRILQLLGGRTLDLGGHST
jgi:hypothetical protein